MRLRPKQEQDGGDCKGEFSGNTGGQCYRRWGVAQYTGGYRFSVSMLVSALQYLGAKQEQHGQNGQKSGCAVTVFRTGY